MADVPMPAAAGSLLIGPNAIRQLDLAPLDPWASLEPASLVKGGA